MRKREREFILGPKSLLLWAVIATLIGVFLHDFKGVPYGWVGGLIWGGALLATFLLGVSFLSRRLLPVQGNLGWSEGFRLLWRNYFLGAVMFLAGRRHEPLVTAAKKKSKGPMLPPSFGLIGAGFLFSHEAAAITRGNSYQRADGPGLVFLQRGEVISQLFDLRTQSRSMPVSAMTRDGIPVETKVSVVFQVRRLKEGERRARSIEMDTIPYRYDRDAIFDLHYAGTVAGEEERLDWTEQVCPQAATLLISEIGRVTLDELLVSAGSEPKGRIKTKIETELKLQQETEGGQVLPRGIEIVGVNIGPLELPEDVLDKRLTSWKVERQNQIDEEKVGAEIDTLQHYYKVRAQATMENVEKLLTSIDAMRRQNDAAYHQAIVSRLVEVLESMMTSKVLKRMESRTELLSQVWDTESQLRQVLEREE